MQSLIQISYAVTQGVFIPLGAFLLANEIGGILILCWKVDLVPDVYEVTYEYTQTSGHVLSYTWSFEIIE